MGVEHESSTDIDPRRIHAHAITTPPADLSLLNRLITLYSNSGDLSAALRLFHTIHNPNVVSWTSLISATANSPSSLRHFILMLRHPTLPNQRTIASLLKTCASLLCFSFGIQLHSLSIKLSLSAQPFAASALIHLYSKTQLPIDAKKVFDETSERDEVCFSSLIVGLAQNSMPLDALLSFADMRKSGVRSTMYGVSAALRAVGEIAALERCRIIHGHAAVTGLNSNSIVATSLIDGYGKCGLLADARQVFDELTPQLNLVGFNAMMAAYAQQGDENSVMELFTLMESQSIVPDQYTFLAAMTAFCNMGLAEETEIWFKKMKSEHGLQPWIQHYTCLANALGRSGRLEEAEKMALTMPFKPDSAIWRTLLSISSTHRNTEMAKTMSNRLIELDPNDDSAYVILANTLAISEKWDEVREVRKMMKERRVRKEGGKSWVEFHGKFHVFLAGDRAHERSDEIYKALGELMKEIEKLGYVPIWEEMLHEVEEGEKREGLWVHSEKLAVAFAVVCGVAPPGKAIRIVKNLRICRDCHEAFKYFSVVVQREIIVRDVNRYHRFLNGACTCRDYW